MVKKDSLKDFHRKKLHVSDLSPEIIEKKEFPKYTALLINQANYYSGGTRSGVVGQMTELVKKCPDKTYDGWKKWYTENYPGRIEKAKKIVMDMLDEYRKAMDKIDEEMVEEWLEDLILVKTIDGIVIQRAILEYIANETGEEWRMATPQEEKRNIDGFIGKKPYSIKPASYITKSSSVREIIDVEIIYYKRDGNDITIYTKRDEKSLDEF